MENLVVHGDKMLANTQLYGGVIYSQKVMLALVDKGMTREDAYKIVQKHALSALDGGNFKQELLSDKNVTSQLTTEEIEYCFNIKDYLKNIEQVFDRF